MSERTADIVVIGGGLAGSMAALRLATAGREVVLLEKEHAAHDKVCGEFLSGEAVDYLRAGGIEPLDLGAQSISTLRVAVRDSLVERALPFPALSLSRRALDEALLSRATANGCAVVRGAHVQELTHCEGLWVAHSRGGERSRAPAAILACGKHDLSGYSRESSAHGDLVGFKQHWRLAPAQIEALRAAMELFLFRGGYGGLSLVEEDVANLCLVVKRDVLRVRGGWAGLIDAITGENRHLATRLSGAEPMSGRPLAIFPIPYGYLASSNDGLWRVGDQAAVIPSFTGDGMAIALHSGALAARMLLAGKHPNECQRELNAQLKRGIGLSLQISKAMTTSAGHALAPLALSVIPRSISWIAKSTRIPQRALAVGAMSQTGRRSDSLA